MTDEFEIAVEHPSQLIEHHTEQDGEKMICQFLVTVTGRVQGGEDVKDFTKKMLAGVMLENRWYYSQNVNSLHTLVEEFDPRSYFRH